MTQIVNKRDCLVAERNNVLPLVEWALYAAVRERFGTSPFHVMMGREAQTSLTALVEKSEMVLAWLGEAIYRKTENKRMPRRFKTSMP